MKKFFLKHYMLVVTFMFMSLFLSLEISKFQQIKSKLMQDSGFINGESIVFHINGYINNNNLLSVLNKSNDIFIQKQFINYGSSMGSALYFSKNISFIPELSWGRFFCIDDFNSLNPLIVIGSDLECEIITDNNKKYININDTNFEVIGILNGDNSTINNTFYINLNYLLNNNYPIIPSDYYRIKLAKDNTNIFNNLEDLLKVYDNNLYLSKDSSKSIDNPIIGYVKKRTIYVLLIVAVFFISTINISNYYINCRRREIGILKALGIKNCTIIKKILIEYQVITIISFLKGGILHYLFYIIYLNKKIYYSISFKNLFILFLLSVIIGTLTCFYPLLKVRNIYPTLLIKR